MLGGSPAREARPVDRQLLNDEDEETVCCPEMDLPQHLKDDLDSLPGTSRRCKVGCLLGLSCALFIGIVVAICFLERATQKKAKDTTPEDRQRWFDEGAHGLPPGFCQEHAMPVPEEPSSTADWAKNLVKKMTIEEKYRMIRGIGFEGFKEKRGYYIGSVLGVPRLGIPCIKMQDGSAGFRTTQKDIAGTVTAWPAPLVLSATWDANLVERWAEAMGREFRDKGANMILAPAVNLHRTPYGGRNAEFISGEDTVLGRELAAAFVKGMQDKAGVAAAVKHFVLNDQETRRTTSNSIADARLRWEKYYPPFQAAIRAGAAAVMCSYNLVNGKQACSNNDLLKRDLKDRMGFDGFVLSDWWAIRNDEAAEAGTDVDMPGNDRFFAEPKLGSALPDHRLDDMVERVLVGMRSSGAWSDLPGDDCRVGCNCDGPLYSKMATSQEHVELARSIASQGAVLLKNDKVSQDGAPVLPLSRSQKIAIIGEACGVAPDIDHESKTWTDASYFSIGGSSRVLSKDDLTLMDGMSRYGATTQISLEDDFAGVNKALSGADVAIVCAGSTSTESADRTTLRLDQDALVDEVLRQGNEMKVPVVVLLLTAGVVVMPWSQAATGILLMFPSGQATGLAAADLLFGAVHPSGKLPVTIPAKEEDAMRPCIESACPYEEKLFVGWHLYDGRDVAYPFGFGLTYTSFEYLPGEMSDEQESGAKSLHVTVKNVGEQPGREILQLYLRFPTTVPEIQQEPATQLRGFHRTRLLQPGEAEEVVFKVGPGDMMVWEMQEDDWTMVYGRYSVGIGASSRDLRLCGVFFHQLGVTKAQGVPLGPCPQREFLLSADGR